MIAFVASALLGITAGQAPAPRRCDLALLTACPDTNILLGSAGVARAMSRFFGEAAAMRVSYLYANGRLLEQVWTVLGGPPDDRRPLPNGGSLFTACRPHSCVEKGAVAFDARGRIDAVGIVSYHCGKGPKGCSHGASLDLFVRGEDQQTRIGEQAITSWAAAAAVADAYPAEGASFRGVVRHRLGV